MQSRFYIVVCIVFALVFARANAFSQGASVLKDLRFDSLGRVAMANFVEGKFFFKSHFALLVAPQDSALFSLFAKQRPEKHVFYGSDPAKFPRPEDDTERQLHVFTSVRRVVDYEQAGRDTVFVRGSLAVKGYTPGYVPVPFMSAFEVFRDTIVPSARITTTVADEAPHSLWDSTLKPVLVTVGAAAIVALFFIIRS